LPLNIFIGWDIEVRMMNYQGFVIV